MIEASLGLLNTIMKGLQPTEPWDPLPHPSTQPMPMPLTHP